MYYVECLFNVANIFSVTGDIHLNGQPSNLLVKVVASHVIGKRSQKFNLWSLVCLGV